MEAAVADVAARLRGGFAETLLDWRDVRSSAHDGASRSKKERVFARMPSRKQPLASGGVCGDIDWRALLLMVFRRFSGELLVEGKLLNHEEIEVGRLARTGRSSMGPVVSLRGLSAGRFIVRCCDAPTSAIGSLVTALVMKQHARMLGASSSSSLPVVSYRSDTLASLCGTSSDEMEITAMESVFGFDVAQFVGPSTSQRRRNGDRYRIDDEDDSDDDRCVNGAIIKHSTFSDLRGVRRLLDASNLPSMQWMSLLTASSGPTQPSGHIVEADPWSFVALGLAQKTLWATERTSRGDALRAKGRLKECLVEYDSALRLDDTHSGALLRRGQVYIELRQYEDANRDLEKLCELEPTNEAAIRELLRAKGKLGHSKRVASVSFHQQSRPATRDAGSASRHQDRSDPSGARQEALVITATKQKEEESLTSYEKDRLRKLLEADVRARKQSRKKSSHRHRSGRSSSGGSSTDSSDSETDSHRKRSKRSKHKKYKKAKRSSDRKKRSKKSSHRRRDEASQSDASSSDRSDRRSHKRSRRSRSRSRERSSRSASVVTDEVTQAHPILSRKPHRLWN